MSILAVKVMFLLILGASLLTNPHDEVSLGGELEGKVTLLVGTEHIPAQLLFKQVKLTGLDGFQGDGVVIAVYEPASHLFWWTFEKSNGPGDLASVKVRFLNGYRLTLYGDRIAGFTALDRSVWVRALSYRFPSMNAALDYVRLELKSTIQQIHFGERHWFQPFDLSQVLGFDYFGPKDFGGLSRGLRLKSLAKDKDGWMIEVINDRDESRLVTIDKSLTAARAKSNQ